ncbi:hypothetical protein [Sphingobacterium griseoflavum]|uniref:Uncharacterized protein n=1 Tax=Sphingobacterium griseoflavum TaxID=1474952 RepID=A0ABQ3HVW9_9SPHI|nr:hypothetical protein [Sphingobacterium griseoflavum]GHE31222.1 hypothetical protein GCM10017764_12900 [Sphingobacterium griseoflavum]
MKLLEVQARGQILQVHYATERKPFGRVEVTLSGKNRQSIYIFSKESSGWKLIYGFLQEDIREACIDAILQRLDSSVAEMFYHEGKRQVVEIRPKPHGVWHVYVNDVYMGSISSEGKRWQYHVEENSCISDDHMKKYIGMIAVGEVRWIDGDGRG